MSDPTIKIALADEHPIFLEGLGTTINSFDGFEVIIKADDGEKLLSYLETAEILPDICIIDVSLPILNGYETLKEIKKKWPDIKVLILSIFNNEMSLIRTVKIGANGFLVKGCKAKELHEALLSVSKTGNYYSHFVKDEFYKNEQQNILLKISYREMEFLSLCCAELSYKGIADKMGVGIRTVESYRDAMYEKLNVNSRIGIVLFALNIGMLPSERVR